MCSKKSQASVMTISMMLKLPVKGRLSRQKPQPTPVRYVVPAVAFSCLSWHCLAKAAYCKDHRCPLQAVFELSIARAFLSELSCLFCLLSSMLQRSHEMSHAGYVCLGFLLPKQHAMKMTRLFSCKLYMCPALQHKMAMQCWALHHHPVLLTCSSYT